MVDNKALNRWIRANQLQPGEIFKNQKGNILMRLEHEGRSLENVNYKDVKGADIGNGKVYIMAWNDLVAVSEVIERRCNVFRLY